MGLNEIKDHQKGCAQMKKPLLDVIFASDKRKSTLLLLQDGPKKIEFFLSSLNTTRQALLPQIKILEEHYLISRNKDIYELTDIGKLIINDMKPLLDTLEVFDSSIDYWGIRKLDSVPPHLLGRISELRKCTVLKPSVTEINRLYKPFNLKKSTTKSVHLVGAFLYPDFYPTFVKLLKNSFTIDYIVSKELLDKIKEENHEEFAVLLKNKSFNLYVYTKKARFLFLGYDDTNFIIDFTTNDGNFDVEHVLCKEKSALEWAKELFEYYLKDSIPITEI